MSTPPVVPTPAADAWRAVYQAKLAEAIKVLTEAARLARPRLQRTDDGDWIDDLMGGRDQNDWAEFVTLALAGAAANYGGVEAILAGRPGSWEAEGVRQLLASTVGHDESSLWEHRTDPVAITLYVDELLADRTDAHEQYDTAQAEIRRRYEAAEAAQPQLDYSHYVWEYEHNDAGGWTARDPAAPAFSIDAWRASAVADGAQPATISHLERQLAGEPGLGPRPLSVHIAKSPEAADELARLEEEREAPLTSIGDLEDALEQQRLREWTEYGDALKARVAAKAGDLPGLAVPVIVTVDIHTYRPSIDHDWDTLENSLVDQAALDTPTPADLEGTPLGRLEDKGGPGRP